MTKHLYVALSGHGFGHIGMAAPVVNELARRCPGLRLTVASAAPADQIRSRIHVPFDLVEEAHDFGMVMRHALEVLPDESMAAYAAFHADYDVRRADLAGRLRALAPDVVLADVPYLTIDAARLAGLPAVAMCSLNWADIFQYYLGDRPGAGGLHAAMLAAYNRADLFLQPAPSMPMPGLRNTLGIGPIAQTGRNRRDELAAHFGLNGDERLLLVGLGGLQYDFNIRDWPQAPGVRYLVASRKRLRDHPQALPLDTLDMPYYDLLSSVDALLTKPGYGTFAEAVCNGVPVLHVDRTDWPESRYLVDWLHAAGRGRPLRATCLKTGDFLDDLEALLAQPDKPPVAPTGIHDAATCLARWLD